jgi:hypothetical protein
MQNISCYIINRLSENQEMPRFLQKQMFKRRFQNNLKLFIKLNQIRTTVLFL